jgi:TonB family protein
MRLLLKVSFVALSLALTVKAQQPPAVTNTASSDLTAALAPDRFPTTPAILQPGDSTELEVLRMEKVHYPEAAKRNGIQGQVTLRVNVSETGAVEKVEPLSGHPLLIPSALASVRKWRYKPFVRSGRPVKVSTLLPLDFAFSENVQDMLLDANPLTATDTSPSQSIKLAPGLVTARLVHKVAPVYPSSARANHMEGTVVLQATISRKGRIRALHILSGPREFMESALGAVQQWRYRPYIVNGEAVEVMTEIDVTFQLTQ